MNTQPTIVILTALPLEYEAVVAYLPQRRKEIKSDNTIYEIGDYVTPKAPWQVVVRQLAAQGNYQAARETEWAITHFDPAYMFLVGVAGGLKDVQLGDVVVASLVRGYESGKAEEGKWKSRVQVEYPSHTLLQLAHNLAGESQWLKKLSSLSQSAPKVWIAPMASGEKVVSSRAFLAQLQETCSDAVAVEMEALGFLGTFRAKSQVQGIVIRGISDLVADKSKTDAVGWQSIAARHAAAFAFAMLDELPPITVTPQDAPVQQGTSKAPISSGGSSIKPQTKVESNESNSWLWIKSILKSAVWCGLTVIFGLLQVWFVFSIHGILNIPLPPKKLFLDGALLFFSTAVVSSLAFDYHYLTQKDVLGWPKPLKDIMFVLFPLVVLLSALTLFGACYISDIYAPYILDNALKKEINQTVVDVMERAVISATLIYAFIVKLVTFKTEYGEHN